MLDLRLSEAAERDLANIRRYSGREHGPEAANAYLRGFVKAFTRLREHPQIGTQRRGLPSSIRGFSYHRHIILYQLTDRGILVARILHQAQDVPATDWPDEQ